MQIYSEEHEGMARYLDASWTGEDSSIMEIKSTGFFSGSDFHDSDFERIWRLDPQEQRALRDAAGLDRAIDLIDALRAVLPGRYGDLLSVIESLRPPDSYWVHRD